MVTRRQFVSGLSSLPVLAALPLQSAASGLSRYQLIAAPSDYLLGGPDRPGSDLMLYNGQTPGPVLSAHKGDVLEVEFVNQLDQPTTIHWHGIRNLNEMDGVPDLTQAAVEPGERFTYRFPLNDAGSFWYHAHNRTFEQVARGLYGPLIVTEQPSQNRDRDILLMADDWRLDADYRLDEASFGSFHDWSHGGRLGNWLTINGLSQPEIDVPLSGPVRLRLMNTANARVLSFQLADGHPMQIIALDGAPCSPFEVETLRLGPAQRADVLVADSSVLTSLLEVTASPGFRAARFRPQTTDSAPFDRISAEAWYSFPDTSQARIVEIHMQGGAMGNLSSAVFEGEERSLRDLAINDQKFWAFNGQVGGYDHLLAELDRGEVTVLRVFNDTRWEHTMHLHGHHFWVASREFGAAARPVLRDTYLMAPGETADLVFVADNPGLWLFHCHMLEHHAGGMGGVIAVS